MKKLLFLPLLILLLVLCSACSGQQKSSTDSQSSAPGTSSPSATSQSSSPAAPASGSQWPTSLVGDLPKPDCQTISYETGKKGSPMEGSILINLKGMTNGDKYIDSLKALGYTSMTNMKVGDALEFIGMKDDKSAQVQVTYNPKTGEASIIYGAQ